MHYAVELTSTQNTDCHVIPRPTRHLNTDSYAIQMKSTTVHHRK